MWDELSIRLCLLEKHVFLIIKLWKYELNRVGEYIKLNFNGSNRLGTIKIVLYIQGGLCIK